MVELYYIGAFVIAFGAFVYCLLPSTKWRTLAAFGYLIVGAAVYFVSFELLGLPKPLAWEWREIHKAKLISYFWIEKEAIYIWLMVDGEPRQYALPWSESQAEDIQKKVGFSEGEEGTGEVYFSSGSEDGKQSKIEAPQKKLPDKTGN